MNKTLTIPKIKIKGISFKLSGEVITVGTPLTFKAVDSEGKDFLSTSMPQEWRIISFYPAINTRVCDLQTKRIVELMRKHPKVGFISISNDEPKTIGEWCLKNTVEKMVALSDLKYGEFARKTNLKISKLPQLARGFILLDRFNRVVDLTLNAELSEMPDFARVESWLQKSEASN